MNRIPLCLITGFLGTGKTTLLRRIIRENRGRRLAFLVNEFSSLDIDGELLAEEGSDVIAVPGGSIFCRCLVTEFIARLKEIRERFEGLEGVVIEASGMADPRVTGDMLHETGLDAVYRLDGIVAVIEPRSFLRLIHTLPNIVRQIEAADLVLLNKCDLFPEEQLRETEAAVREIRPDVTILRAVRADAPFPLFGIDSTRELHGEYARCRDPHYAAFSIALSKPLSPDRLLRFIQDNEDRIYRVKGYFPAEPNGELFYFDYSKAGARWEPAPKDHTPGLAWIIAGDAAEDLTPEKICANLYC